MTMRYKFSRATSIHFHDFLSIQTMVWCMCVCVCSCAHVCNYGLSRSKREKPTHALEQLIALSQFHFHVFQFKLRVSLFRLYFHVRCNDFSSAKLSVFDTNRIPNPNTHTCTDTHALTENFVLFYFSSFLFSFSYASLCDVC